MTWLIAQNDARQLPLKDQSVQCVVTSPPYWGLRDYGVSGQIGLEQTPQEYVARMVEVFREVRRVLRDDGTCWVNLGDSYSNAGTRQGDRDGNVCDGVNNHRKFYRETCPGLKNKDLVGIPWRVAFALQADGWYLRSDIIWSKPNPMPESVTDRPTKAHEYVFLLAKRERYFFDQDAVREKSERSDTSPQSLGRIGAGGGAYAMPSRIREDFDGTRNIRTVWEIATQPFPQSHFATFPEELAIRCIKAGSKPGSIVLDPFGGAGTVALVADKLNRTGIALELKREYCQMARKRCYDDSPLFA